MLVAPHFLTGVAIASATQSPELASATFATVSSHFVLDAIPHRDTIGGFHLNKANILMEVVDTTIALSVFFWLVPRENWAYAFIIGGVAILPDLFALPGLFWKGWYQLWFIKPLHTWHTKILQHDRQDINWFWGLLPQVLIIVAVILIIKL